MDILLALIIAFLVSTVSSPWVIKLANKYGFIDSPNRKHPAILHTKPIPRGGGVPPLLGFVIALVLIALASPTFALTGQIFAIILASSFLVIIGLLDDKYDLNPYFRLVTNFLAVGVVVASGIGVVSFTNPLGGQVILDQIVNLQLPIFGQVQFPWLSETVTFIWVIWVMNALNWSSGVDGQLSGIASVALIILGIAAAQLVSRDPSQTFAAIIAFAAAGAFLGFLPWSFFPQKIMPGYGGSTLAGFLIAILAIVSGAKLATALLVLIIPLVDSIWTIVRRLAALRSPVWGDRLHLHHQLLKMGWSIPKICLFYYSIGLILGMLALNFDTEKKFFTLMILAVLVFSLLFTVYALLRRFNIGSNESQST